MEANAARKLVIDALIAATFAESSRSVRLTDVSRAQVATEVHLSTKTIGRIRKRMPKAGLRRVGENNGIIAAQVRSDTTIWQRIEKAVGLELPSNIRAEATIELYTDVLEGRVGKEHIERRAAHYRNRAWNISGSKFGPLSLDAENEDGFSLGDSLDDPEALEEMERAATAAFDW